jgi:transposase
LKRWAAFARFLDGGRICRSNAAAAEWAVHGIAIGRCSWMFAGSDAGGHGAAVLPTPIETCESNDSDRPAWLAQILARPRDRPAKRRDKWPPWNWTPRQQAIAEAA